MFICLPYLSTDMSNGCLTFDLILSEACFPCCVAHFSKMLVPFFYFLTYSGHELLSSLLSHIKIHEQILLTDCTFKIHVEFDYFSLPLLPYHKAKSPYFFLDYHNSVLLGLPACAFRTFSAILSLSNVSKRTIPAIQAFFFFFIPSLFYFSLELIIIKNAPYFILCC